MVAEAKAGAAHRGGPGRRLRAVSQFCPGCAGAEIVPSTRPPLSF
jgi:hypothetical protein